MRTWKCECWNKEHNKAMCGVKATKSCVDCPQRLCAHCAADHHIHENYGDLPDEG